MTIWHINDAPESVVVRVRVAGAGETPGDRSHEPPYLMVREGARWFYARTMAPVFPWHVPVAWSDDPITHAEAQRFVDLKNAGAYPPTLVAQFFQHARTKRLAA